MTDRTDALRIGMTHAVLWCTTLVMTRALRRRELQE
jgi:hypothetical protein